MRRVGVVMLGVGLLMGPATLTAAQDAASGDGAELQRLEVPDAGVAVSLPPAWNSYIEMREKEDWGLHDEGFADEPVPFWTVIYASDGGRPWCDLTWYPSHPLALDAHAQRYEALMTPSTGAVERPIEVESVSLPAGEAYRFDIYNEPSDDYTMVYLLGRGDARYQLQCVSDERVDDDWLAVAESLELTDAPDVLQDEDQPTSGVVADRQRVEIPEAGVAVSLPPEFGIDLEPVTYEMGLPPDAMETTPVTTILLAGEPGVVDCGMEVFESNPLTLEEHAEWVVHFASGQPDFEGSVTRAAVSLPVGAALRIDGDHQAHGVWTTVYLFDHGDMRYQLYCRAEQRASDDYLSIVSTIELLDEQPSGEVPSWVPDDAVAWDVAEDYVTEVPVAHEQEGAWLMSAWCERALWLEYADGTFEERVACTLTDDPVEPPELQGQPPAETLVFSGGGCEWYSDYWYLEDGSQHWADSWSMSVEPDGTVLGLAVYGAEAADCVVE